MSTPRTKSLALRIKASGEPSPEQLAAIRGYTLRDFDPAELVVREFVLAHNAIDRDDEVFDEGLLADFVRTLPGKGVYIKHPTSWQGDGGPAEGRCFAARSERMSLDAARTLLRAPDLQWPPDRVDATVVYASAYFVKTEENAALLLKMDAGIAGDCSIGFCAETRMPIRDSAGRELEATRLMGPGEAHEFSLVWLGAQPGARAVKSAHNPTTEDHTMTPEQVAALQAENASLKAAKAEGEKSATTLAAIKTALGNDAALADNPAKLAAAVSAGKAYRERLVDDIVSAERHLGITADDEASVKASRELYADMPVAKLEIMGKSLEARLPAGGKIRGTDPNAGTPGNKYAAPPAGSPLANPLITGAAE